MNIHTLEKYFDRLFPICRSILGKGYRQSLQILSEIIPFNIIEFKSGQKVFDWVIPKEWNVYDAYLKDSQGRKIVDFKENNLHLLNYSIPFKNKVYLEELKHNLYTDREQPDAIPYVTSYYKENWGLSIPFSKYKELKKGELYEVFIDTDFKQGTLQVGEYLLRGRSEKEIIISTYLCHPSMGNNELSGPLVMLYLYNKLKKRKNLTFSYRFVVNPETIGSIAYLSLRKDELKFNSVGGIVLTCLGGPKETLSYKKSKKSDSLIDRVFERHLSKNGRIREFTPLGGSDERQYNTIGIDIPIGQIARTVYSEYPQYHTSLDDKTFMDMAQVYSSCKEIQNIINSIENASYFKSLIPYCEPQLGKRGLYPNINSKETRTKSSSDSVTDGRTFNKIVMYLLNYSDGTHSIQEIANKIEINEELVLKVAYELTNHNLLKKI